MSSRFALEDSSAPTRDEISHRLGIFTTTRVCREGCLTCVTCTKFLVRRFTSEAEGIV